MIFRLALLRTTDMKLPLRGKEKSVHLHYTVYIFHRPDSQTDRHKEKTPSLGKSGGQLYVTDVPSV